MTQTQTKFTPGPWKILWNGDAVWSGNRPICNLAGIFFDPKSAKANARLIASAPDLLAALEGLVEDYEAASVGNVDDPDSVPSALRTARAAIAAAREG